MPNYAQELKDLQERMTRKGDAKATGSPNIDLFQDVTEDIGQLLDGDMDRLFKALTRKHKS